MESRYLYRGKRIDNGKWVEGYLSYPFCTEKGNESYYFYAKDSLGFFCRCVVDASTICQCTGREDMNGKLIFENDILSGHIDVEFPEDETRKRVVWHADGARMSRAVMTMRNWMILIQRILRLSAIKLTIRNCWRCEYDGE